MARKSGNYLPQVFYAQNALWISRLPDAEQAFFPAAFPAALGGPGIAKLFQARFDRAFFRYLKGFIRHPLLIARKDDHDEQAEKQHD
ncbi:MAG: hypothetical protein VB085_03800 [Peptococcaceae bacterium]|nr:hypothetical protein [Peptococcaceae bacterium]